MSARGQQDGMTTGSLDGDWGWRISEKLVSTECPTEGLTKLTVTLVLKTEPSWFSITECEVKVISLGLPNSLAVFKTI